VTGRVRISRRAAAYGTLYVGDALDVLAKRIAPESVRMVFADPPYNLTLGSSGEGGRALARPDGSHVAGVDADWDRFDDIASYRDFTRSWLQAARAAMHPDGTIWVTGTYHNIFVIGAVLQELGFWILNDIVWRKSNPMPNFRGRRFTNAHETLIWASKSRASKYVFNYASMKSLNGDTQMRSDWLFPVCRGRERLADADGTKLHPTQKPEALVARAVMAATAPGDLILDPFFGTGTTGAVARRYGRRFVGVERDPFYAKAAWRRIAALVPIDAASLPPGPEDRVRDSFGALVEAGIVPPGTILRAASGGASARVLADGSVAFRRAAGTPERVGSIQIAAAWATDGARQPDGWTFWRVTGGRSPGPLAGLRASAAKRPILSPRR